MLTTDARRRIRAYLAQHRGAHGQLAAMLGVSQSHLTLYLQGRAKSSRIDEVITTNVAELKQRMAERERDVYA